MSNRRTMIGAAAQLSAILRCPNPADIVEATSLNRKLSIQPTADYGVNEYPSVRGFVFGIGGQNSTMGVHGLPLIAPEPHTAVDHAPFYMIPLVLREVGNDLSATERERYFLRKTLQVNGVTYIAYYGRRMDTSTTVIKLEEITVANNTTTSKPFVPKDSQLSPVAVVTSTQQPNPLAGQYGRAFAPVSIAVDSFDVTETIAACAIMFGPDTTYANITEIAICTGVDRQVTGDNGSGGTVSYNEVIGAQVMQHIQSRIMLADYPEGYGTTYDFGGNEPLYLPR